MLIFTKIQTIHKSIHNRGGAAAGAAAAPIAAKPRQSIVVEASAPEADGFCGAEGLSPRGRAGGREKSSGRRGYLLHGETAAAVADFHFF